jgi:hypothetical protein
MLSFSPATRIFLALSPVDMRAGFNRLYTHVQTTLQQDPLLCGGGESVAPIGHARERSSPNYFRTTHIIPVILPFIDRAISQVV